MIEAADAVDAAVKKVLDQGYRTVDIFQNGSGEQKINTREMGDIIAANL
jgi:3-isopropylmalate dehydrogenase